MLHVNVKFIKDIFIVHYLDSMTPKRVNMGSMLDGHMKKVPVFFVPGTYICSIL